MSFTNKAELRSYYGEPAERARKKQLSQLDVHCRKFIELSPFFVLSTAAADGSTDASPKGDLPGFVAVLDDHTLLIPDRPGNNRVDSFQNVLENPHVGLLFFVPGINETLRVNGRAHLTIDPELLAPMSVNGKQPRAGLVVKVEEAYLHCAKALIRSQLWDPERQIDRKSFPTMGQMLADQIEGLDPVEVQKSYEERNRNRLY
jgi:PPOX class probable FMN-dependent enzyme